MESSFILSNAPMLWKYWTEGGGVMRMKAIRKKNLRWLMIGILAVCLIAAILIYVIKNNTKSEDSSSGLSSNISLHSEFFTFDVAMNPYNEQIGYADKEYLCVTSFSDKQIHKMRQADPFYELIAFDSEDKLWWGFDSLNRSFHVFSDTFEYIKTIEPDLSDVLALDIFKVHKSRYLLLAGESQQHEGRIWICDLTNDTLTQYKPNGMVISFLASNDSTLVALLSTSGGPCIEWYNVAEECVEKTLALNTSFAACLGIDRNNDLYYATNRSIFRVSDKEQDIVCHFPSSVETAYNELNIRIFPVTNGCYVWIRDADDISYIPYFKDETENNALVVDASFYVPTAMSIYESTGKQVEFRDHGIVSAEKYLTLMLSQDSEVDVYMLRSYNGAEARSIIEKGFYEDLNQSEIIAADASKWFERIYKDSTSNEKLFGYPYGVAFQIVSYKPEELERIGLSLPDRAMTWNEFLDLLEQYGGQKPFPLIVNPTHLTQLVLWQAYNSNSDSFKAAIEEALLVLNRCKELGMYDLSPSEYVRTYQFVDNYAMRIDINTLGGINELPFMPVPTLTNSQCGTPIWYDWLLINPYSEQKKEAFAYIEAHAHAHIAGGLEWSSVLSPITEYYPRFSNEWLSNYSDVMEHSSAFLAYALEEDFMSVSNKYIAGKLTLSDAINQMVDKYSIAMNE